MRISDWSSDVCSSDLGLVLSCMICMIFAALNGAQQATAAAEREAERQARLMNAIVENIPVGVCLFDGDLSLVAFNSEYAKLLDIPRSLLESGATFQDLLGFNAERGEYGGRPLDKEIESRTQMMLTSNAGRVELERPNAASPENSKTTLPR